MSRRDEFERDNQAVEMPECQAFHVLEYLMDLGVATGEAAITHLEIYAWMQNTGIELSSWEAQTIKRLSNTYLSCGHNFRKLDAETPWVGAPYYMSADWRKALRLKKSIRHAAGL